ncbi:hypothetical protein HUG17_3287 [Dermatophagoides farinae]|uniref:Uncharacterized protein n=1 Tax=Dermatophagoides farinae TaxID=6954 RepID=A0A9D4NV33_DERFA|nr:hypothetical protein HUG17_3287 [Dermatophagoides farinae]
MARCFNSKRGFGKSKFQFNIYWPIGTSGKISIIKSGKCFLTGYRSSELNNLYYLPIRVKSSNSTSSTNVSLLSSSSVDLALLHERFCHVNKNTIIRMAKSKIVDGLSTICSDNVGFCNACSDGKITDVPHRSTEKLSYAKSGESIHIDIAGYTDRSIHGNKYYLICVDEKTSYVKVEFLKNRGDFFNKFIKIVNQIKLETVTLALNDDKVGKFESKATDVYMVGYQGDHIYRCYLPNKREVHLISAVKFDEIAKCRSVAYEIPGDNFVSEPSTSLVAERLMMIKMKMLLVMVMMMYRDRRPLGSQNKT